MKTIWMVFAAAFGIATSVQGTEALKDLLPAVGSVPMKEEFASDPTYLRILAMGKATLPDLVDCVVDTRKMKDPREVAPNPNFVVGDLAVILLCRITGRGFEEQLPQPIAEKYHIEGMAAYFEYVRKTKQRKVIQRDWRGWLARNGY